MLLYSLARAERVGWGAIRRSAGGRCGSAATTVLRAVGPNGGWVVDQPMWSDEKAIGAAACAAPRLLHPAVAVATAKPGGGALPGSTGKGLARTVN
jgi:hypothetical protein